MKEIKSTRLYLVRHAQSESNHTKQYTGWRDVDLSEMGHIQSEHGERYFRRAKIDNIYTSTLKRAFKTAEIIFGNDAEIKKKNEFKDINLGLFEKKTHDELLVEYSELYRSWVSDPMLASPPEGESILDHYKRVTLGLKHVISENKGKTAVIVAHSSVIKAIVVYTLNMNLKDIWGIKVDNLSVSVAEFMGDKKALIKLNDTSHIGGYHSPQKLDRGT